MRALGKVDDSLKGQLITDYKNADISDNDKLILDYAEKITRAASSIDATYVANLKSHGFSDRMIHDIVQTAAYFNYINRLADALGVELEG